MYFNERKILFTVPAAAKAAALQFFLYEFFQQNFYLEIVHFSIVELHFCNKFSNGTWFTFNVHTEFN